MLCVIHVAIIIAYIALLLFSIKLIYTIYLCDDEKCQSFENALKKPTTKKQTIYLIDALGGDGIWSFAYIGGSILTSLLFAIIPLKISIRYVTTVFLLIFLVIYSIMSFYIHHYLFPIKKYVSDVINTYQD